MTDSPIPADLFSRTLREMKDNPGALASSSTVHAQDFYGNSETWVIETYRNEQGNETVFLQRSAADGGMRLVLPPAVTSSLARHRDQLVSKVRRRAARRSLDTKRERGIDPAAALRRHRKGGK